MAQTVEVAGALPDQALVRSAEDLERLGLHAVGGDGAQLMTVHAHKRRGKGKALVAVARSILVIIWHLLANPTATYHDLGADYYTSRIDKERRKRDLVQQLEALGLQVTLTPAAA
jgi:hypothetical protein